LILGSHCTERCCPTIDRNASVIWCTTQGNVSICVGKISPGYSLSFFLFSVYDLLALDWI